MSKWKTEKWTADSKGVASYYGYGLRELFIVACADIDAALAEAISKRLIGTDDEIAKFIGADENSLAPIGTLGNRIQMARMLGILRLAEVVFLVRLKKLRNLSAHRINADFHSPQMQAAMKQLMDAVIDLAVTKDPDFDAVAIERVKAEFLKSERAWKMWLIGILIVTEIGLKRLIDEMRRIAPAKHEGIVVAAINVQQDWLRFKEPRHKRMRRPK
jgi:hypothetical protein